MTSNWILQRIGDIATAQCSTNRSKRIVAPLFNTSKLQTLPCEESNGIVKTKLGYKVASDQFVIRRPAFKLDRLDTLLSKLELEMDDSQRLRTLWSEPEFRLAIELGAPSLFSRVEEELRKQSDPSLFFALLSYFVRMCTRATPFGAFAHVAVANEANACTRDIPTAQTWFRLELDAEVLWRIHERIVALAPIQQATRYSINPTAYETQTTIRFFQRKINESSFRFSLVSFRKSPHLCAVFESKNTHKTLDQLSNSITETLDDVTEPEARDFVQQLIDADFLRSTIDIPLITRSSIVDYLSQFSAVQQLQAVSYIRLLREVAEMLASGEKGDVKDAIKACRNVESAIEKAGLPSKRGHTVQVDAFSSSPKILLDERSRQDLLTAVQRLCDFVSKERNDKLQEFTTRFEERFGEAFVPITAALDPDTGVPFGFSSGIVKWLDGVHLQSRWKPIRQTPASLLKKTHDTYSSAPYEIDLLRETLTSVEGQLLPPPTMTANISFVACEERSGGDARKEIKLNYLSGPGNLNLIARFAARENTVNHAYQHLLALEAETDEQTIHAEIIHLPRPRMGNVLRRPSGHQYELMLSGHPSLPFDRQLHLSDLLIAVWHGEVILWSQKHNKRVIPTLTSAYNQHHQENLGIFQFLCTISKQSFFIPNFSWGSESTGLKRLPRVKCGPIIISMGRWRLDPSEVATIKAALKKNEYEVVRQLLLQRGLPRRFALENADQVLEIDSNSKVSLGLLGNSLREKQIALLCESPCAFMCPELSIRNWHHSELLVPLQRTDSTPSSEKIDLPLMLSTSRDASAEQWQYLKIYGGESYLEKLLITTLFPLIEKGRAEGRFTAWFYLRYSDPEYHIRLRFRGPHKAVNEFLQTVMSDHLLARYRDHEIANIQTEQYVPELKRYGGLRTLSVVEEIFYIDSCYAVRALSEINKRKDGEFEWIVLLVSTAYLLRIFVSTDFAVLLRLSEEQRDAFASELQLTKPVYDSIGKQYKGRRDTVERILDGSFRLESVELQENLESRTKDILKLVTNSGSKVSTFRDLAPSIIHMQFNRLMSSPARPQEYVMWDYIARGLRSLLAKRVK